MERTRGVLLGGGGGGKGRDDAELEAACGKGVLVLLLVLGPMVELRCGRGGVWVEYEHRPVG